MSLRSQFCLTAINSQLTIVSGPVHKQLWYFNTLNSWDRFRSYHSYHLHTSHGGEYNIAMDSHIVMGYPACWVFFFCFIHIPFFQIPYSWFIMTIISVLSSTILMTEGAPLCMSNIVSYSYDQAVYHMKCVCFQNCLYCDYNYAYYDTVWCYETCSHESKPFFADFAPGCRIGKPPEKEKKEEYIEDPYL